MSDPVTDSLWQEHLTRQPSKVSAGHQRRMHQEAAVYEIIRTEFPDLLDTNELKSLKNEKLLQLYEILQKGLHPRDKQLRLAYIGRVIEAVNILAGTTLPQPPAISFRIPAKRFTPDKFALYQQWQLLQKMWTEQLTLRSSGPNCLFTDVQLAFIGWLVWTGHPPPHTTKSARLNLYLFETLQNQKHPHWLPPELTALIKKLNIQLNKNPFKKNGAIFAGIKARLKTRLPLNVNFKALQIGRQTALSLTLPPYLCDLLYGVNIATPLPTPDIQRILMGMVLRPNQSLAVEATDLPPSPSLELATARTYEQQDFDPAILTSLRSAINTGKNTSDFKNAIVAFKETYQASYDSMTGLIVARALHLLKHGGLQRKVLRVSSIRRYLGCFYSRLIKAAKGQNVYEFDEEDWRQCYEIVMQKAARRGDISWNLSEFHTWLSNEYGITPIDFKTVEGFCHATKKIHAKLVSPLDVDRACDLILSSAAQNDQRSAKLATIILKLGFYCGLRRNEILFLRRKDLQGTHDPYLIITPHKARKLKTETSRRQLPLRALLPAPLLDELLHLRDEENKSREKDSFIFADADLTYERIKAPWLINICQRALRLATGDEEVVFHSLRHSFANWAMIRLAAVEEHRILDRDYPLFEHPFFERDALVRFRSAFMEETSQQAAISPDRRGLYAISSMMGHAEPGITLTSYIHLHGWLSARLIQLNSPLLSRHVVAWLADKHISKTYQANDNKSQDYGDPISSLFQFSADKNQFYEQVTTLCHYQKPTMHWPPGKPAISTEQVVNILKWPREKNWAIAPLIAMGYAPESAERWVRNAKWIESLQSQKKRKDGSRHRRIPKIKLPPMALIATYRAWLAQLQKAWKRDPILSESITKIMLRRLVPREHIYEFRERAQFLSVINWLVHEVKIEHEALVITIRTNQSVTPSTAGMWTDCLPAGVNLNLSHTSKTRNTYAELKIRAAQAIKKKDNGQETQSTPHVMAYQVFEQALAATALESSTLASEGSVMNQK
ncbi:site-specific integrase [Chitinibacter sp. ZOR0017]|uniref:site-specific integrase n=1 Tax=Chitinibacter sp. ZOR0017 TaxID=1339254 RepID=UPI0006479C02|nr:site-specific integrase [Chitinibacter sp. ZOR0017]